MIRRPPRPPPSPSTPLSRSPAAIVTAPPLEYPPALRRAGLQGRVTVQAVIDTLGRAEPASLKVSITACTVDRKSTRLNSSHGYISYAVFCLKKKTRVDILQ